MAGLDRGAVRFDLSGLLLLGVLIGVPAGASDAGPATAAAVALPPRAPATAAAVAPTDGPAGAEAVQPAPPRTHRFLHGADVSFLSQVEAGGGLFRDGGEPSDLLAILRARGVDTVRLRLWHAPADERAALAGPCANGSLAQTLALAARARAAGCDVLLDLHYSDTWADPGHQAKPAAWAALPFPTLADSVRAYTRDVLAAFAARGTTPVIVQLGNEITAGLLWDDGRVGGTFDTPAQWDKLAALLAAAAAGVADAFPPRDGATGAAGPAAGGGPPRRDEAAPSARPEIMLHLDRGGDNAGARRFLDNVVARGVAFDLIGLSYYPWWHGALAGLQANLSDLATRYNRDLVVVETGYPWTLGWFDDTHNLVGLPSQLLPDHPATPQGQRAFLADVLAIVRAVPGGRGRGACWWEPEWIPSPRFGSAWENVALFDEQGHALPALRAFADTSR